jgi:hypothetical protein
MNRSLLNCVIVKDLSSEAEHDSNGEDFDRMLLSTISMTYGQLKGLPRPGITRG